METEICINATKRWITQEKARWVVLENKIYFWDKDKKTWATWSFSELMNYLQAFYLNLHTMKHLSLEIVKTAFQEAEAVSARTHNGMGTTGKDYLYLEKNNTFILDVPYSNRGAAIATLKACEFLKWSVLWEDVVKVFETACKNIGFDSLSKTPVVQTEFLKSVFHLVNYRGRFGVSRAWSPRGWRNLERTKLVPAITFDDKTPKHIKWNMNSQEQAILINAVTESLLAANKKETP